MLDFILLDGDKAVFVPAFGVAMVVVKDGVLAGQGGATLAGTKVCIDGDEMQLKVEGCDYAVPAMGLVDGKGTLKILALGPDQRASKTHSNHKPVLLKGSVFQAQFSVTKPAQTPPGVIPPLADAIPLHVGTGSFKTENRKFKGT